MGYLLARMTKKGRFFKVMYSENRIYNIPKNYKDNSIIFTPEPANDEYEWLRIEHFSNTGCVLDIMRQRMSSAEFDKLDIIDRTKIDLILENDQGLFFFQKITPTKIIKNKSLLSFNKKEEFEITNIVNSIELAECPVAIYDIDTDILYFKKFSSITTVFPGIEKLYREATNEEVEEFLNNDIIDVRNFNYEEVDIRNRKKIALVLELVSALDENERRQRINYISNYSNELELVNGRFVINDNKKLHILLLGLQERFFETEFSGEKCVAIIIKKCKEQ